jgi:hypothetical protein
MSKKLFYNVALLLKTGKSGIKISQVPAFGGLLQIKDNANLVAFIILRHCGLVPCDSFNCTAKLVALAIIRFTICCTCESRVGQCCDLKVAKETVGIAIEDTSIKIENNCMEEVTKHEYSTGSPIKENDDPLSATIARAHDGNSQAFAQLFEHYTNAVQNTPGNWTFQFTAPN